MTDNGQVGTLEELMGDVRAAAVQLGVPVADVIWDIMRVYEHNFLNDPVSFRITTKPEAEMNLRYQTLNPQDTYRIAVENGFLTPNGHPVYDVMPEFYAMRPDAGYCLDLGVSHGYEKNWAFFAPPLPTATVLNMASLPPAMKNHLPLYQRYEMDWVSVFGVDYLNNSANIYFMGGSFPNSPELARQFILDLGFDEPPAEDAEFNGSGLVLYVTYTWDADVALRVNYTHFGPQETIPAHFPQAIHDFAATVPLRTDERNFAYSPTYVHNGPMYHKIEADYRNWIGKMAVGRLIETATEARNNAKAASTR